MSTSVVLGWFGTIRLAGRSRKRRKCAQLQWLGDESGVCLDLSVSRGVATATSGFAFLERPLVILVTRTAVLLLF
jgi:hypothetical protein